MNDTPWIVEESYDFYSIRSADGDMHLTIGEGDKAMKRAERIVAAVNNHEPLVEALKLSTMTLEGKPHSPSCVAAANHNRALLADIDKESS